MPTATRLITLPFETLPESAKQVANQAYEAMDRWIDERVDDLKSRMEHELSGATQSLETELETLQKDFAVRRQEITGILDTVKKLKENIELGDGQTLTDAIDSTQKQLEVVKGDLEAYERRWKALGEAAVQKLAMVVGGIIK
jgi:chromosome segregation ATPase